MAFTYDLTTDRGKVRFLIPDNDSSAYDLQDAEVDFFLTEGGTTYSAAIKACLWLARKYAKQVSFSADGLSMQHTQRAQAFAERAKELQAECYGYTSSVELDREDGYEEAATDSEYEREIVYVYND